MLQDLRYAIRQLRKTPGFAVAAILTLAIAIGANTTIFSIVDWLLLRPLPVTNPGRLTTFWQQQGKQDILFRSAYRCRAAKRIASSPITSPATSSQLWD